MNEAINDQMEILISFISDDSRFNASKSNHCVDLDEAMEAFNILASSTGAEQHSEVVRTEGDDD